MTRRGWQTHYTLPVGLIVLLALSNFAKANTCVPAQSGVWSAAATWTACGGTIPQAADTVSINTGAGSSPTKVGYIVTLDTSPTVVSILIDGGCCWNAGSGGVGPKLITDGTSAHTITTTVAASDCIVTRNSAFLDMSAATAGKEVTFACPNQTASSQAIIANRFGSPNQGNETIKCYHCIFQPGGTGDSIFVSNAFSGAVVDIRNSYFTHGTRGFSSTSSINNVTFIGNTFDGLASDDLQPGGGNVQGWVVTDNTDINSTVQGRMLKVAGSDSGLTFARNAAFGTGAARELYGGNNSVPTVPIKISYNIGSTTTASSTYPMLGYCAGAASAHCTYDHNVSELYVQAINTNSNSYIDLSYNIGTENAASFGGQGCWISLAGSNITSANDSCLLDSNNGNIGWLMIGGGSNFSATNDLYYMGTTDSGNSFSLGIGEGSGLSLAALNVSVSNTISLNVTNGFGVNNSSDTFVTSGTGSVGVFNNLSIGASISNYNNPSSVANFGAHPSSTYGDITLSPGILSVTRRLKTCDAIAFSGPGTNAHLFGELAKRWNGTNQANVTPANIWNCMAAPLAAQNTAIATLGYGGTFVGAYKPKVVSAVAIP